MNAVKQHYPAEINGSDIGWEAGQATASWPEGIEIVSETTYVIKPGDGPRATIGTVAKQRIDPELTDAVRLHWYAVSGCEEQKGLLLAKMTSFADGASGQ